MSYFELRERLFGYQRRGVLQVGGDMVDMKNSFLSSPSSQFYTTGNTDFQTPNRNVLPETNHNLNPTVGQYCRGFCRVNQGIDEGFAYPRDLLISHGHLDFQGFTANCDRLAQQLQGNELLSQKTSNNLVESSSPGLQRWRGSSKRIKTGSFEEQSLPQPEDTTKLPLPRRRSQKLSDKITLLQKLVSPYGKTNTAAVLQEACLYIKLLQRQIENSYNTNTETQLQENEEKVTTDLRRRGLCLVPVSFFWESNYRQGSN